MTITTNVTETVSKEITVDIVLPAILKERGEDRYHFINEDKSELKIAMYDERIVALTFDDCLNESELAHRFSKCDPVSETEFLKVFYKAQGIMAKCLGADNLVKIASEAQTA